jgi:hypothetical protein
MTSKNLNVETQLRHRERVIWLESSALVMALALVLFSGSGDCQEVQAPSVQREATHIDYSKSHGFPNIFSPYTFPSVPEPRLDDSRRLQDLIVDGKLTLTLEDAIALALENNGGIAVARYDLPIAQTDLLRAKGGGATRGVAGTYQSTTLFSGSLGGGVVSGGPRAEAVRAAFWEEASIASARRAAAIQM